MLTVTTRTIVIMAMEIMDVIMLRLLFAAVHQRPPCPAGFAAYGTEYPRIRQAQTAREQSWRHARALRIARRGNLFRDRRLHRHKQDYWHGLPHRTRQWQRWCRDRNAARYKERRMHLSKLVSARTPEASASAPGTVQLHKLAQWQIEDDQLDPFRRSSWISRFSRRGLFPARCSQ